MPSCWVSSRGETDRFLYYDGLTIAPVPLAVSLDSSASEIRFSTPHINRVPYGGKPEPYFEPLSPRSVPGLSQHEGLYIEVYSGRVRARAMEIAVEGSFPLQLDPSLTGESAVSGRLREMLLRYGLTGPEADGLIAAWAPQFFRAEGRRFILRMSPAEYARQCPMQVRPTPTEVVRLGLVLTEFDQQPASTPASR